MSVNNFSATEDTEMAEVDGEKVVTMMDVLQEQQDFEDDANAVLGASDDKECTYAKGYIKRQAVYACLTCCSEAREDPEKRAGVCLACSLNCHENHDLIELYTKRNFCCDCGNNKFNSNPCQFTPTKTDLNSENVYNQNFSGLYCVCHRPYPDPDTEFEDEMIQCIVCEDWLHAQHLDAKVPPMENYSEMICKGCMDRNEFLHDYSEYAVNIVENGHTVNVLTNASHCNGKDDISVDVTNEITDQSINVDKSILKELSHTEKNIQEADEMADEYMNETNGDVIENGGDIIDVKTLVDTEKENEVSSVTNGESMAESDDVSKDNHAETSEKTPEETETPQVDSANEEHSHDKEDVPENITENSMESKTDALIITEETTSDKPETDSTEIDALSNDTPAESLPSGGNLDVPLNEENSEVADEPENKDNPEPELKSDSKSEDEPKVEESNVENKQISPIEEESAENDIKPEEDLNMEDIMENNQIDSTEEKASEQNFEINAETDKNIDTAGNAEKTETVSNSETVECKESNGESPHDVVMADKHTSGSEIVDLPANEIVKELSKTDVTDLLEIDNDTSKTEITNLATTNGTEKETKRKLSIEDLEEEDSVTKKQKLDCNTNCIRPKNVKKTYKGATFWPGNFRQKLCKCNHCLTMYKDLSVLYLIDVEDTVSFYEALGKEKSNGTPTQYEQGLEALSSLDRIQQINALTEYNIMRDKLLDFLKSFKERKEVVKEEDIKAFFAGMKPKREPDGVYFCR